MCFLHNGMEASYPRASGQPEESGVVHITPTFSSHALGVSIASWVRHPAGKSSPLIFRKLAGTWTEVSIAPGPLIAGLVTAKS